MAWVWPQWTFKKLGRNQNMGSTRGPRFETWLLLGCTFWNTGSFGVRILKHGFFWVPHGVHMSWCFSVSFSWFCRVFSEFFSIVIAFIKFVEQSKIFDISARFWCFVSWDSDLLRPNHWIRGFIVQLTPYEARRHVRHSQMCALFAINIPRVRFLHSIAMFFARHYRKKWEVHFKYIKCAGSSTQWFWFYFLLIGTLSKYELSAVKFPDV